MKKFFTIVLVFAICCGLGIYFYMDNMQKTVEEIVLPTVPQIAVPTLPAREDSGETAEEATGEAAEPTDPTGETHPWETEFTGEGYNLIQANICDIVDYTKTIGKSYAWYEGGIGSYCARYLQIYDSGEISDTYYYPAPNLTESHSYWWGADGSYKEFRYLDGGYREILADGSLFNHMGTLAYYKIINADGTWKEFQRIDDDDRYFEISQHSDGYYLEEGYFENGDRCKYVKNDPAAGIYQEEVYYENGQLKNYRYEDSQAGTLTASEYFENRTLKYFYNKTSNVEIELIADETGKLIKAVENGTVIEDAATLTQYAQIYNFKE